MKILQLVNQSVWNG